MFYLFLLHQLRRSMGMCGYWGQINLVENTWHCCRRGTIRNELDHDYILRRPFWHLPTCYLPYFGHHRQWINSAWICRNNTWLIFIFGSFLNCDSWSQFNWTRSPILSICPVLSMWGFLSWKGKRRDWIFAAKDNRVKGVPSLPSGGSNYVKSWPLIIPPSAVPQHTVHNMHVTRNTVEVEWELPLYHAGDRAPWNPGATVKLGKRGWDDTAL